MLKLSVGKVMEIENTYSDWIKDEKHLRDQPFDGLRIRVELPNDRPNELKELPWAFPLLPKTFQSIPKVGESVLVLSDDTFEGQRYYIGPIISQPQFNTFCQKRNSTSLLLTHDTNPLEKISNNPDTTGAFPSSDDVAIVGRGSEDISLKYDDTTKKSEVTLRAGIRTETVNDPNPNMIGNIIFNGTDPAYIQLKYKKNLMTKQNQEGNSVINLVANQINLMSNKDDNISHNLHDNEDMIADENMDEIMQNLHQVPMGDKLVELLTIIKGCILHHVHPWAGMEQCGDWSGYINQLNHYDIKSILSQYVRIS